MIDLSSYVVILVVGICMCVGYIIKHLIPSISKDYIPAIMGLLGVLLNSWVNNFTISPEIILGGLVSGLASTGTHECFTRVLDKLKFRK